jgi:hypothetical protein
MLQDCPELLRLWHCQSDALTTDRLDLINKYKIICEKENMMRKNKIKTEENRREEKIQKRENE